ncbi:DEKNAAC104181 [Brettanomyces naardenensis]|uniref:DEKNAAC104181 n=1 Tax=Brettanomyces naardenensis TaxID=13370 RepID=A0A448YPW4_BRENA|nr:DEKNAAC104181 [Brettanomyces naardenensis]
MEIATPGKMQRTLQGSSSPSKLVPSNATLPTSCGCYDGEGYSFISPLSDISPCVVQGIFGNLLALSLIISGLIAIQRLRKRKNINARSAVWFPLKLAVVVLQTIFQIALVIYTARATSYPPHVTFLNDSKWWSTMTTLIALNVALVLSYIENYKTFIASTSLIAFWFFSAVLGVFRLINVYLRSSSSSLIFLTLATTVNAIILVVIEINSSPKRLANSSEKYNPIDYSNIFSRLTFTWLTPLMQKGYEKFLEQKDLPSLPEPLRSQELYSVLQKNWNNQLNSSSKPSLVKAIAKSFGKPFLGAGIFKLIQDCIAFIQPQLLKRLILFVNDYSNDHTIPLTRGFMIVLAMFGCSVVQTAALHQYFQRVFDTGIKIKSSLNCLIYSKSLVLSPEAKQKKSTGDIVNLMSVDTQRLQDLCQNLQIIWSGPFQIILCLTSLYQLIGNAMWVGVFILVITVPLNTMVFRQQRKLQKRQMSVKDERTGLISEMLNNIRSLKLYAWESPYKARITDVRNNKELSNLKKIGVFQAGNQFIFNSTPHLVSTCTFALFLWQFKKPLSTDIVFTALSLFNLLGFPLAVVPWVIGGIIEAQVSIKRLTSFLTSDELDLNTVHRMPPVSKKGDVCVEIDNADFLWSRDPYKIALVNINYKARKGDLNCFVGRVGAGKSSILQAILGDLHKTKGIVITRGTVAYVPQIPWIMNGTIKENILFGCRYEHDFYQKTLKACALALDLAVLPDGDSTQVGEKGISLSGGQKARLSLARAVYSRADIYVMDDILSAVDEHVGKHLINNVLGPDGLLKSRCRILSTNNLHVLEFADQITMLSAGRVIEEGSYDDLMTRKDESELFKLLDEFGTKGDNREASSGEDEAAAAVENKIGEALEKTTTTESSGSFSLSGDLDDEIKKASKKDLHTAELEDFSEAVRRKEESDEAAGRDEKHEHGKVKWDVYLAYFNACGIKHVILMLVFIVLSMTFSVSANVWLKHWSELNSRAGYNPDPWSNLGIYFALCMSSTFFLLCQTLVQWLLCSISGSKILHQGMLDSVLRAPMEFFETTPIGRILNRFSNDIYKIDETLFRVFNSFFSTTVKVFFTILVIVFSTWEFVFFIIPLAFIYRYYQKYYLASSRELRRLDSVSRSPIFAHFEETLTGVATIRAYNQIKRFIFLNQYKMDTNMSAYHPSVSANRWLAVRLEFLGSMIILSASGLLIITLRSGHVTPGLVGLSVSYALQVTQSLNWIVRMTVDIESNIVSVERVLEYSHLTPEAPEIIKDCRPATNWPFNGAISFDQYSARYRPELDLVLKDISISIGKKEKIGIVGRTGAGKSSLTLAIFRIIEAAGGHITIDGVNTSKIGLFDLRSRLSIIPQDSQIFQGTIRSNLDPTDRYSDEDLLNALRLSHLEKHVQQMYEEIKDKSTVKYNPLLVRLSEGGSNLSVGQRQLTCLARALCKKDSKILVLDEATANVDVRTDSIVQETIRSAFKERTILTIAHRLNTIIDSDRIMVLDKGRVAEFDTPDNLLRDKDSLFYSLCREGGLVGE